MLDLVSSLATSGLSSSRATGRPLSPSVRRAGDGDVAALTRLINRAYQVERFFVDGERIDAAEVAALRTRGHFLVLDGADRELAAAVYVRMDGDCGGIGLLSVAPECQGAGLGRRLVAVAEALCAAVGCRAVELSIVNLRQELGPWYRSQGYREVGTAPFDQPATQPCHFIRMQKQLTA